MAKQSILFEAIDNVLAKKDLQLYKKHVENEELWKTFSKFMLLRYMTMSANGAVRDIVLNNYVRLERMPDKAMYKWLIDNIPQQRSGWIKYIK